MDVLVAGGHGQIARRLLRLLAKRGHTARGLIRNPNHVADLEDDGAHPVLCDLETDDVRPHVGGAYAIVFAAGAGPGSGPERKQTVDLGGALKCIEAAQELGVPRFLMVSSMGNRYVDPADPMYAYAQAKAKADDGARGLRSGLDDRAARDGSPTSRGRPGSSSRRRSGAAVRSRATTSRSCSSTACSPTTP